MSFIIPALQFTVEREVPQILTIVTPTSKPETTITEQLNADFTAPDQDMAYAGFDWYTLLPYVYAAIVACLLLLTAWKLIQLFSYTRLEAKKINGLKLVTKNVGFTNCSFFNYVFIDYNSLTTAELDVLLKHEEVHAKSYHSIDKLFMMVVKAVLWFNPVVYLYDKALEEAHEYEADEATSTDFGTEPYAMLLLKLAVTNNTSPLTHNFVKSPIKQRIKMLFNSKSNSQKKLAYLFVLPLVMGLMWFLTVDIVYAAPQDFEIKGKMLSDSLPRLKTIPITTKPPVKVLPQQKDTLRLVGGKNLGKNPKVIIDGKDYQPAILTQISPKSILSTKVSPGLISIKTINNKIEMATPADIRNVKIKNAKDDDDQLYRRYPQFKDNGEQYDVVEVRLKSGGMASVDVASGAKVLILIGGKPFSEEQAKLLSKDFIADYSSISATEKRYENFAKMYPGYANEYDAALEIPAYQNRYKNKGK